MVSPDWGKLATEKQASTLKCIPKEWILERIPSAKEEPNSAVFLDKVLPDDEVVITNKPLHVLASEISKGQLTAISVTKAFCHRAALAHQLLNCCTEIFFDQALSRAEKLDEYFAKEGKTVGPLHGIPISLKDQVNLPGMDTSIGYIALLNKPKKLSDKSDIAIKMEELGAVFYVKTTVPMAMMSPDTYSNAFGYTQNAINRNLSAGGSSGGEGALIGSKASLLGLGTDIGGSIRIPAAFNGLYALRPSFGRMPYQKVDNSYNGQPIIPSVIGPLAQNLDDLELFTKSIVDTEPWTYDSKIVPIPWRPFEVPEGSKFSFGVMKDDGGFPVHPPIKRAIELVSKALLKSGHDLIDWEPQHHEEIIQCVNDVFRADSGKEIMDMCAISGEPNTVKRLTYSPDPPKTVNEHWEDADKKYAFQKMYLDYWNSTKERTKSGKPVDAWIAPVWHSASTRPYALEFPTYTMVINALDYSVVIVPVTRADKSIDTEVVEGYDPEVFHGAPASIQVITRRLEEEKAIALAKVLSDALAKN